MRSDDAKLGEKENEVATRQCERYAEKLDEERRQTLLCSILLGLLMPLEKKTKEVNGS